MIDVTTLLHITGGIIIGAGGVWVILRKRMRELYAHKGYLKTLQEGIFKESSLVEKELPKRTNEFLLLEKTESSWNSIRQELSRLRAVLETMSEGLALLNDDHVIVRANPAFVSMFRTEVGRKIKSQSIHKDDLAGFEKAGKEAWRTGKTTTTELRISTTPPRDIIVTITPFSDKWISRGLILTAVDITSQREAESLRSEFVANVSHELRTPLAAIRGYVETCLEPDFTGPDAPYDRFLPIVLQHTQRLNALIEDLLTLSRIESRATELMIVPLRLSKVVESAIGIVASHAKKKNIRVISELPPSLPDIRADNDALERILLNLIENAIKYSDEGRVIRIKAKTQTDEVCVMVEDEGLGIPREAQERIFERFFRVDKARSRKAGGTGLGLSIVKHLVQSHGGEVWVDSEAGRGSTFFFTLPMAHASEQFEKLEETILTATE